MSVTTAVYRFTVYARRNDTNPNESDVLTPISGSVHSDPFVVTSKELDGAKPYLKTVSGETGNIPLPTIRATKGRVRLTMLDARVGDTNEDRWVTAFIGTQSRRFSLIGRKAVLEVSEDNGVTWKLMFVGRISAFEITNPLEVSLEVDDTLNELTRIVNRNIPKGRDYVIHYDVFPAQLNTATEGFIPSRSLYYKYLNDSELAARFDGQLFGSTRLFQASSSSEHTRADTKVTTQLWERSNGLLYLFYNTSDIIAPETDLRVRIKNYLGEEWEAVVSSVNQDGSEFYTRPIGILGDPEYVNFDPVLPPTASGAMQYVTMSVYDNRVSESNPFYLSGSHPVDVLIDVLSGSFNLVADRGLTIPFNSGNFADVKAQLSDVEPMFVKVTGESTLQTFIEDYICRPYGLAYIFEPQSVDGIPQSVMRLVNLRVPDTLPTRTITDADVLQESFTRWELGSPLESVRVNYGIDLLKESPFTTGSFTAVARSGISASLNAQLNISPTALVEPVVFLDAEVDELTTQTFTLDKPIIHRILTSTTSTTASREEMIDELQVLVNDVYFNRFAAGPTTVTLTTRRSETIVSSSVGDWFLVQVSTLPDPNTNRRGTPRLMQMTQKTEQGAGVLVRLIDGMVTSSLSGPTIQSTCVLSGSLTASISNPNSSSLVVDYITTNEYEVTYPSHGDSRWTRVYSGAENHTTASVGIVPVSSGDKVWVRTRAEGVTSGPYALPSRWVGTGTVPQTTQLTFQQDTVGRVASFLTASISGVSDVFTTTAFLTSSQNGSLSINSGSLRISHVSSGETYAWVSGSERLNDGFIQIRIQSATNSAVTAATGGVLVRVTASRTQSRVSTNASTYGAVGGQSQGIREYNNSNTVIGSSLATLGSSFPTRLQLSIHTGSAHSNESNGRDRTLSLVSSSLSGTWGLLASGPNNSSVTFSELHLMKGRYVTVVHEELTTGWYARVRDDGGNTLASSSFATNGTASVDVDLSTIRFPTPYTVDVVESGSNTVLYTMSPTQRVWGGDRYTVRRTPL